ncbi:MAG: oligosaccharide flippase family protein [Pseudomonadota bacterium]
MARANHIATSARRWAGMATAYFLSSGAVQLLGAISTFIYVRLLDTDNYALLALCLTTMAFIALTTDLGLTGSLNYFKRRSLQQGGDFGRHIAIIQRMRLTLFPIAAVIAIAALMFMVSTRGHLTLDATMALAALVLAAYVQLNLSVRQAVLRIEGFQNATYFADVAAAGLRALTAVALLLLAVRLTSPVIGAIALSSAVALALLNWHYPAAPQTSTAEDKAGRAEVLRYILPTTPAVLLFAMQDLVIYAIVWMATGAGLVANIFALGRISALIAVVGGIVPVVVMPRIANMAHGDTVLRRGYAVTGAIGVFFVASGIAIALLPDYALLLIGERYAHLQHELLLSFAISGLSVLASSIGQLNRAMGWVRGEPWVAAIQLTLLLALFSTQPITTTADVLLLWLMVTAVYFAMLLATTLIGMMKPQLLTSQRY